MIKSEKMLFVLAICLSISLRIEGACPSVCVDSSEGNHWIILFLNTSKTLITDFFPCIAKIGNLCSIDDDCKPGNLKCRDLGEVKLCLCPDSGFLDRKFIFYFYILTELYK